MGMGPNWVIRSERHGLRLYAALSSAQRRALWEGQELRVSGMTRRQRELFLAPYAEQKPWYPRFVPDAAALAAGRFSLTVDRWVRYRDQEATRFPRFRDVTMPDAGSPDASKVSAPHCSVAVVRFHFHHGEARRDGFYGLVVTAWP
jgi:hypothetical protein